LTLVWLRNALPSADQQDRLTRAQFGIRYLSAANECVLFGVSGLRVHL
jgi:hypothetical protein